MIFVKLKGGMGNQMFQYALGRAMSLRYGVDLRLDTSFFYLDYKTITKRSYSLDVFNIKAKTFTINKFITYIISFFRKIIKNKGVEKSFQFDKEVFSFGPNVYLDGYWQSPKYFVGYEDVIRKDFTLKNPLKQNIKNLMDEIKSKNSICVHVRRGDYVGNKNHEVVDGEYYKKAIDYISKIKNIEKIYVFSDDIKWCKGNIFFEFETMFVGEAYSGDKSEGHLFLMSACKDFIIPNSSFSWWAAWLSTSNDKIVVIPQKWFPDESINTNDLIPENWIKI
ncbi:alpha-1,2-fucosyltransferase [Candidatus Nomurabacteria bacterium]|nr:alpha-1,2-fucosyltransferase [Candidatus Nomurabacteria bacterium]